MLSTQPCAFRASAAITLLKMVAWQYAFREQITKWRITRFSVKLLFLWFKIKMKRLCRHYSLVSRFALFQHLNESTWIYRCLKSWFVEWKQTLISLPLSFTTRFWWILSLFTRQVYAHTHNAANTCAHTYTSARTHSRSDHNSRPQACWKVGGGGARFFGIAPEGVKVIWCFFIPIIFFLSFV